MSVRVTCTKCGKKLRVPSAYLNKKVKCPECQQRFVVQHGEANTADPAEADLDWRVQSDDGCQYGPVDKNELDSWVAEGRLDARCQVLQDGWPRWRWADEVYPQLQESEFQEPETPAGAEEPDAAADGPPPLIDAAARAPSSSAVPSKTSLRDLADGDSATPGVRRALAGAAPWMLFMAIVEILVFALSIVVVIANTTVMLSGSGDATLPTAAWTVVVLIVLAFTTLLPAYLLMRCHHAIGAFLRNDNMQNLHRALLAQRRFWTTVGVLTTIALAIGLIVIAFLFAIGLGQTPPIEL